MKSADFFHLFVFISISAIFGSAEDKQIRSKRRAPYQIGMNFGIRPPYSSRPKKRGFEIGFSTGYKRPYYPDGSYSPYTTTTTTTMKPVKKRYYVPVFWIPEKKTTTTTTQAPTTRKPKRKAYDFYYPWNWWFYAHHNRYREEPETGGDEESYSSSYSERPQNYYTYKQRPKTITWKPLFQITGKKIIGTTQKPYTGEPGSYTPYTEKPTYEYIIPLFKRPYRTRTTTPAPATTTSRPDATTRTIYFIDVNKPKYRPYYRKQRLPSATRKLKNYRAFNDYYLAAKKRNSRINSRRRRLLRHPSRLNYGQLARKSLDRLRARRGSKIRAY